jgi:hypothetical protein
VNERSVARAFESIIPVEVCAPFASCAFGATLLAVGLMAIDGLGAEQLAVFAPPAVACAVATALFANRRNEWGLFVPLAVAVVHTAIASAAGDKWALVVVPIASLLMIGVQVPFMFAARITASLRAADRGDTFVTWSALWSAVVFFFLFYAFGRESSAAHACLFSGFVSAFVAVVAVRRAVVRRDVSRLARTGRLAGHRVRTDLCPGERNYLQPLFGGNHHWEYGVLERFHGPTRPPARPRIDAYRGPQPGPIAGVRILPGAPIGLIPMR